MNTIYQQNVGKSIILLNVLVTHLFSSTGQDHVAMGPTGQERPQEATARPHPGNRAQGRARSSGAHK